MAQLESPAERTGLSFATSDIDLDEPDSESDPQETPLQGEGQNELLMRQATPPPSNTNTTDTELCRRLEQEKAALNERIEQMNVQLNSFISNNVCLNSENDSEVVRTLQ